MNDHPLGNIDPDGTDTPVVTEPSIVDQILNLDKLLSADVRRAEKTARICLRPDLEARLDELEAELEALTDAMGNALDTEVDADIASGGGRTARVVATERVQIAQEMAEATYSVRMGQMSDDDWTAFLARHKKALDQKGDSPERKRMFDELVVASASAPTISADQWRQMRAKLGAPQIDELINTAWVVNSQSGVSIPKSPLSSVVLKPRRPDRS